MARWKLTGTSAYELSQVREFQIQHQEQIREGKIVVDAVLGQSLGPGRVMVNIMFTQGSVCKPPAIATGIVQHPVPGPHG